METASELTPAVPEDSEESELVRFLSQARVLIDTQLDSILPGENVAPERLHSAIRWSVFAGGKRFRPALVLATGETFGARRESLVSTACAFEMIHTYSLVHDDLPSMDNDELRRGRPTCHKKFDEATAILVGDALQTLAFQTIARDEELTAEVRVRVIAELAGGSGTPEGMVAGQAFDLAAESRSVRDEELQQIHLKKTGALICAAVRSGAVIAGVNDDELAALTNYAAQLGLLFQITDDLLDVTATASTLGKTPGKDARSSKATYPALYGIEATREHLKSVHQKAGAALESIARPTELLGAIAGFIRDRET